MEDVHVAPTPTSANAQVEGEGTKKLRRRRRMIVDGSTSPSIWAIRYAPPHDAPITSDSRTAFGTNLFRSEPDMRRATMSIDADIAVRSFSTLPGAIKWAKKPAAPKDTTAAAAKTEEPNETCVGRTWVSPRFPRIACADEDDDDYLSVEVQAARNFLQDGSQVIGYDCWFDGARDMSKQSDLPKPSVSRAVLEGCINALKQCDEKYGDRKGILLASPSSLPYLAAMGTRKGMPESCQKLANMLQRMCNERPVSVSVCVMRKDPEPTEE
jgi:hypothetical protein